MKLSFVTLLVASVGLSTTSVLAATPPPNPTPQLKKADQPFINLGSELGGAAPISNLPASNKASAPKAQPSYQKNRPSSNYKSTTASYETNKPKPKTTSKSETKPPSKSQTTWSYGGKDGPKYWGDLSEEYSMCGMGQNQSPVDLRDNHATATGGLAELEIRYRDVPLKVINTGHAIQVNYPLGSYIKLSNKRYEFLHYEFHTPSEHKKEGFNYPMEIQLIHSDGDGNKVNIGIIVQEGEDNEALQMLLDHLPRKVNKQEIHRGVGLNPVMFFPGDTKFYKYSGSMTKPPCTEGAYWMVFKHPIEASAEQIQQLNDVMGDNNRPIQSINARNILKSWSEMSEPPAMYEFY